MKFISSALAVCLAMPTALLAQQAASPVADAFRSSFQEQQRNLVEAAEQMPADKYGFKPTPAQMSFGKVVVHLASGNTFLCGVIGGKQSPNWPEMPETAPKDSLVARLRASFEFCGTALTGLDDSKLGDTVPWFGDKPVSRAYAMFVTVDDWADHYSQSAIYMRLNGLLPPTARRNN